jgi:hypothetical protein
MPISRMRFLAGGLALIGLAGCGSGGNLKADNTYHGSRAEPVKHPKYDPYAAATWVAPTYDRHGTIVAPQDPSLRGSWEDYEDADWFQKGSGPKHPPGTF